MGIMVAVPFKVATMKLQVAFTERRNMRQASVYESTIRTLTHTGFSQLTRGGGGRKRFADF